MAFEFLTLESASKMFCNQQIFLLSKYSYGRQSLEGDECYAEETIELVLLWSLPQNANASLTVFCSNHNYPIPIEQIPTTRLAGIRFHCKLSLNLWTCVPACG